MAESAQMLTATVPDRISRASTAMATTTGRRMLSTSAQVRNGSRRVTPRTETVSHSPETLAQPGNHLGTRRCHALNGFEHITNTAERSHHRRCRRYLLSGTDSRRFGNRCRTHIWRY